MNVHLRFEESNPTSTRFTVVVNETTCGELLMNTEDAVKLAEIVKSGCSQFQCDFESSGKLFKSDSFVLWHKRSGQERRSGQDRRKSKDRRSGQDRRN